MQNKSNILTACILKDASDKENESLIDYSYQPEKNVSSSRIPARILPTYIFSLNEAKPGVGSKLTKSKNPVKCASSRNFSAKSQRKITSKEKAAHNYSLLSAKRIKKTNKIKEKLSQPFDLDKLVKAVSKHCELCHKFKEELHRQSLYV